MPFSSLRFGQYYGFRPKVCFYASGSKRFEILPFSSGSLTPSIFLRQVKGIFVFFVNLKSKSDFFTLCTSTLHNVQVFQIPLTEKKDENTPDLMEKKDENTPVLSRKMNGVNEPDEMARFQTFWIQMQKNKPLDESRKTDQTSGTEMAFYSLNYRKKKNKPVRFG
ncbi:hypothetical protein Hanom_Chr17g01539061 [Helianthus anomalus]